MTNNTKARRYCAIIVALILVSTFVILCSMPHKVCEPIVEKVELKDGFGSHEYISGDSIICEGGSRAVAGKTNFINLELVGGYTSQICLMTRTTTQCHIEVQGVVMK